MIFRVIFIFICFNCVFGDTLEETPLYNTTSGLVRGQIIEVLNQSIEQFLGIPYAEPPIGDLRFAKPKPIQFQNGVIDATKPKYSCIQNQLSLKYNISEDCLLLNIWSPKSGGKLKPVMFWIYGGALSAGSIFLPSYDGRVLVTHDIVFVSVNYRLGPLGFLYSNDKSTPGNVGFFDQLLGLKWVRENIHLFGGDKNQITIFGESAGSWSTSMHLISPLSKGLFKRAIMESAAFMYNKDRPVISKEEALLNAKQLAKRENCSDDNQWLQCLRKVDAHRLIPGPSEITFAVEGTEFLPLSAQKAFNELKFNRDLDLMAGVNRDEGSILVGLINPEWFLKTKFDKQDFIDFVNKSNKIFHNINVEKTINFYLNDVNTSDSNAVKWKVFDFLGHLLITCPTYHFAKRYAQNSNESQVFFYELTHKMSGLESVVNVTLLSDIGIYHSADLDFVFGLALLKPNVTSEENIEFSKQIMKYWTNFAKYGKPDENWIKFIDFKNHSTVTQIKELNPKNSNKFLNHLFDKTCDGIWKDYF